MYFLFAGKKGDKLLFSEPDGRIVIAIASATAFSWRKTKMAKSISSLDGFFSQKTVDSKKNLPYINFEYITVSRDHERV